MNLLYDARVAVSETEAGNTEGRKLSTAVLVLLRMHVTWCVSGFNSFVGVPFRRYEDNNGFRRLQ